VILADEELRDVAPEKSTDIEIQKFVNEAKISGLYFENRITSNPTMVRARLLLFYGKR
jgi:non-homologous end joining protein Ku